MSSNEIILSGAGKKKKKRFQINLKQREGTCRRPYFSKCDCGINWDSSPYMNLLFLRNANNVCRFQYII